MAKSNLQNSITTFSIDRLVHVVLAPAAVIGLASNKESHVRVQGQLHSQHALIVRHGGSYWICAHPGQKGYVAVDNKPALAFEPLHDGNQITLGHPENKLWQIQWRFEQTEGSRTVVLRGDRDNIVVESGLTRDVVLMAERLAIGRDEADHLTIPQLPCEQLIFETSPSGLSVHAVDGIVFEALDNDDFGEMPQPIGLPIRIRVEATGEARLRYALTGDSRAEPMHLKITR